MKFRRYRKLIGQCLVIWLMVVQFLILMPAGPLYAAPTPANSIEDRPFPTEEVNKSQTEATGSNSVGWALVKLVISLAVIILLAYFIIRIFGKQANRRFQGRWLQVIDELIIGPNRGVVLCEIGGRILALGVTDHQINVLFEVNDEDLIKEMLATGGSGNQDEWSQLSVMKGLIDRIKGQRTDRFAASLDQWLEQVPENTKERGRH